MFMEENLSGLENFCLVYRDDILIFTKENKNDHF